MDWKCSVYVYEDVAGCWTVHVAGNEPVGDFSNQHEWDTDAESWFDRHQEMMKELEAAPRKEIDTPSAGESFYFDSPGECADFLVSLRDNEKLTVPQYAIDELYAEQLILEDEIL